MRRITKKSRAVYASLLLGMYVFMAFFAFNFHHHGSALVFKDFQFKNSNITISKAVSSEEFIDCLSCHVQFKTPILLSEDTEFKFIKIHFVVLHVQETTPQTEVQRNELKPLRGPPLPLI